MARVVEPGSVDELAVAIREASAAGLAMSPVGGGTKLDWGNPVAAGVEIRIGGLAGVLEHSWGDLTATVAAGTTWSAMQRELARHGQRVALDPMMPEKATVGGVLATNDCGLLRMRYGSLRDLVLGMTVVLADGTMARTGGKVVKNVAGYDLPKLLTGSFGTLGIIAEATFRLHPVAAHVASLTVRSDEVAAMADLMAAILRAGMSVERMQLRNELAAYALDVEFASLPEVLVEHEARLRGLAGALPVVESEAGVWESRDRLFADAEATVLKVTALPSKLAALVAGVAVLGQLPEHTAACVADPVGIVTLAMRAAPERLASIVEDLRARLLGSGGAVVVLRRGALPESIDAWGPVPGAIDVMRAIKAEFDPGRLLNPGKFMGGI
jgi:glycolate oxidase FAD binding subunit